MVAEAKRENKEQWGTIKGSVTLKKLKGFFYAVTGMGALSVL